MASDQAVVAGNSGERGPSEFVETEDPSSFRKYGGKRKQYLRQTSACCFRDLQNPKGLFLLLIKDFQVTWNCSWSRVRVKFSFICIHNYH